MTAPWTQSWASATGQGSQRVWAIDSVALYRRWVPMPTPSSCVLWCIFCKSFYLSDQSCSVAMMIQEGPICKVPKAVSVSWFTCELLSTGVLASPPPPVPWCLGSQGSILVSALLIPHALISFPATPSSIVYLPRSPKVSPVSASFGCPSRKKKLAHPN